MKLPLVVSDLDGTLLNSQKRVGAASIDAVNRFVAGGGLFTVATARMPYGAAGRISALDMRVPAIVMNGAALYNFADERFETSFPLDATSTSAVAEIIDDVDAGCFAYVLENGGLTVSHRRDEDLAFTQYYSTAAIDAGTTFRRHAPSSWETLGAVVYVAVVGTEAQLAEVAARCDHLPGVRTIRYENVYTQSMCVELASTTAGKENALRALLAELPADGLVAFGDGLNDVDMLRMADLSFAPRTADEAALAVADHVIESNDDDAVGREIERRFLSPTAPR